MLTILPNDFYGPRYYFLTLQQTSTVVPGLVNSDFGSGTGVPVEFTCEAIERIVFANLAKGSDFKKLLRIYLPIDC